ncbi:MAG TPA: translocation/assembly module TamB domain-containing protein [Bryobacteraceae bacterium]|nr:translocation/assembly module TamB domain-containing protein [Bryobacteraceae bacterium]
MTRPRLLAIIFGSLAALVLLVIVAGIIVVQTDWFRDTARQRIISGIEDATGGKAEIGAFDLDWQRLRVQIRDFVLRGTEPRDQPPLFRARLLQIDLGLLTTVRRPFEIRAALVDTPQGNIIVYADGTTNIPGPKEPKPESDSTALRTIVDLAIGRFDVRNGSILFAERRVPVDARGRNLRAQLFYDTATPAYKGQLAMAPLEMRSGGREPVDVSITIPVVLEHDRIRFDNALIRTPESQLAISGIVENLKDARIQARLQGHIALDEARRAAGLEIQTTGNVPRVLQADASLQMGGERIQLSGTRLTLGRSTIQASGVLRDAAEPAGLNFNGTLDLGELGRLLRVAQQPEGVASLNGTASMTGDEYLVRANVDARRVAATLGTRRFTDLSLASAVQADPRRIDLTGMRLGVLGGTLTGRASIDQRQRFEAAGRLDGFDLRVLASTLAERDLAYGGVLSGTIQGRASFESPKDLIAGGNLTISPAPQRGVPVRGSLQANYDGRSQSVALGQSWLALPQSRINLSGTLGNRVDVRLASRNLQELAPGVTLPVHLNGGSAAFDGSVLGSLASPRVTGQVRVTNFRVQDRPFNLLAANLDLSESRAVLQDGTLQRGTLDARIAGSIGLQRYRTSPQSPLDLNAVIRNGDLRDVLAVAGQSDVPASGLLNASARIGGTLGSPRGDVSADVIQGAAWQQPFDTLTLRASLAEGRIAVPTLAIAVGPARVSGNLAYAYTPGELRRGNLTGQLASTNLNLAELRALTERRPGLGGTLAFKADFAAGIRPAAGKTAIDVQRVDSDLAVRGLQMRGEKLGDLTATTRTAGNVVQYNLNSNFAGSGIQVTGRTTLAPDYPTEASARINNLPIDTLLAVAGRPDIQVAGTLEANATVAGTLASPRANANVTMTKGVFDKQPLDRLQVALKLDNRLIEVPSLMAQAGEARLEGSARLAHPGDYRTGDLQFRLATNRFDLAKVPAVAKLRPGTAGTVEARAEGAGTLRPGDTPLISRLNAFLNASSIQYNGAPLGDLQAVAETRANAVVFNAKSNFAGADIAAAGNVGLSRDYPLNAELNFRNVTYAGFSAFLPRTRRRTFDVLTQGRATVSGPAVRTEDLKGRLELSRLDMYSVDPVPGAAVRRALQVRNAEPVVINLDRSVVTVQSAHLIGPYANVDVKGSAALVGQRKVDLRATGDLRLDLLETFLQDAFASGNASLNAAVQGTLDNPQVAGRLDLRDANFNMINWPAGLSEARGSLVFTGRQAVIQDVTGLVGGGKVNLTGSVAYGGPELNFRLQTTAREVNIQYPPNVNTSLNADISLTGATSRSVLSGSVTILDAAFYSHSDIGSIFAGAAEPTPTPPAQVGLLAGMRLDLRIETAPDAQFRTTLTENIDADAEIQIRGTAARPGALGRMEITQGDVEFFGNRYKVDQGSVAFYNPNRLEPIVNIDLTTRVRGIDVTLTVSGPVNRMQLTYRSDPPLGFTELISLLAGGSTPTTDPVLAAREPVAPQQTFQQKGASALLGQAVASPVAGRLQRLFGVSTLRIDPQIVGAENTPQARFTLQQQVTRNILFTYIQDVTESNPQIIRVEWAFNPVWSAIIQRQENGAAGLDLFWRRRFR